MGCSYDGGTASCKLPTKPAPGRATFSRWLQLSPSHYKLSAPTAAALTSPQGGTVALELARQQQAAGQPLGSCVAVSAALLPEQLHDLQQQQEAQQQQAQQQADGGSMSTAVLITRGTADKGESLPACPPACCTPTACSCLHVAVISVVCRQSLSFWHHIAPCFPQPGPVTPVVRCAQCMGGSTLAHSLTQHTHNTHMSSRAVISQALVEQTAGVLRRMHSMAVELHSVPGKAHAMPQARAQDASREMMLVWRLRRPPVGFLRWHYCR